MAARHPYKRGEVLQIQLVAVTSVPPKTTRTTDCFLQDWQAAGLRQPSWMRSHLATVHRALIVHKVGTLAPGDLGAVERCLAVATGL